MEVKTFRVGHTETNCYIVYDKEKGEASVIDPGAEAETIIRFLSSYSLKTKEYLFNTRAF